MRIVTAHIQDYKRVRSVTITPDADSALVLIGGKNRAGKSSIIDALSAAIGGAKSIAGDPVRHGADAAEIRIELDGVDGKLTVRRVINPDKSTSLEIRDADGFAIRSPQATLDALLGARFIDPLAFLQLPAKEMRAQLMRMIPGAERIAGLNAKRDARFTKRTEVGRDHDKASAELARLPVITPLGALLDVAALAQEQRQFGEQQRLGEAAGQAHRHTESAWRDAEARVDQLEHELKQARDKAAAAKDKHAKAKADLDAIGTEWTATEKRRAQLDAELARAGEHNRAIATAEAQAKRREEVQAEVARLAAERASLTNDLALIDSRKAEILTAAKLPVDGLAVTDDGIELAGVPFAQASAAERMRVALALAVASSPGLDDIWVRDGALLDDEMLAAAVEHAAASNKRLWVEVISTSDPGVIVIQDGRVQDAAKGAA